MKEQIHIFFNYEFFIFRIDSDMLGIADKNAFNSLYLQVKCVQVQDGVAGIGHIGIKEYLVIIGFTIYPIQLDYCILKKAQN